MMYAVNKLSRSQQGRCGLEIHQHVHTLGLSQTLESDRDRQGLTCLWDLVSSFPSLFLPCVRRVKGVLLGEDGKSLPMCKSVLQVQVFCKCKPENAGSGDSEQL